MAQEDKRSEKQLALAISATLSGVTPSAGNIVDMDGFEAVTFCFATGAVTDAGDANGFTIKLQHSDTTAASDFADVTVASDQLGANLTVTSNDADNVPVGMIGYVGNKRYVRCVVTGTTGTNAVINGVAVKECARYEPPAVTAANIAAT